MSQVWTLPRCLACKKGKVQVEGEDGVLEEGLRPRVARQKPRKLRVGVSLVAACDVRVNGNYVRGWCFCMEGISRYRSCIT